MKKTYFIHQSNSFQDYKIIKMRSKLGIASYGVFWAVLELLFNEENKLCIDDYDALAYSLQCDTDLLRQVIEDFELFVIEDNCFYSKRLNSHIEEINNKSKQAKINAAKRWNNAVALPKHKASTASISNSNSNSKLKKSNYYNDISFPDYYDIHYAKRIEQDVNKTKEYHKHLESIGYVKEINNYSGQSKWVKK